MVELVTRPPQIPLIIPGKFGRIIIKNLPFRYQMAWQTRQSFRVLLTEEQHGPTGWWRHASCSHPNKLPTWEEIKQVKNIFVGRDLYAFHILPKEEDYINAHPYAMHIWCPLDHQDMEGFSFLLS